jgi:trimeric autotransporter adhesin
VSFQGQYGVGNGPGLVGNGGSGDQGANPGGDGIDAFAGTGSGCPPSGCPNGLAGSFIGDVYVSGNLNVSGTKSFRVDHPLDPANKYLYHAALESSEVLNLYSGNTVLDANGETNVQLPDWFEALNRDFRYQLTAIGAAAPNLHIAQEIQNRSFKIAGGPANTKVSWQVTGVRQDAWEKAHPMAVEVAKPARERGYYLNPELFGAPPERSMEWARNPRLMKRLKDLQEKQAKRMQVLLAKPGLSGKP